MVEETRDVVVGVVVVELAVIEIRIPRSLAILDRDRKRSWSTAYGYVRFSPEPF